MAKKVNNTVNDVPEDKVKQDLKEIKLLLATMLRDISTIADNLKTVTYIEKIKAGME